MIIINYIITVLLRIILAKNKLCLKIQNVFIKNTFISFLIRIIVYQKIVLITAYALSLINARNFSNLLINNMLV